MAGSSSEMYTLLVLSKAIHFPMDLNQFCPHAHTKIKLKLKLLIQAQIIPVELCPGHLGGSHRCPLMTQSQRHPLCPPHHCSNFLHHNHDGTNTTLPVLLAQQTRKPLKNAVTIFASNTTRTLALESKVNNNNNNRLFMMPHLVRAQSAYKDIRIHPFHHTHTHYKYMHYW